MAGRIFVRCVFVICQQPITSRIAFSGSEHWIVQIPLFSLLLPLLSLLWPVLLLRLLCLPLPSPPKDKQRKTFGYFNFTLCDINSCRRLYVFPCWAWAGAGAGAWDVFCFAREHITMYDVLGEPVMACFETKPLYLSYCFPFTNVPRVRACVCDATSSSPAPPEACFSLFYYVRLWFLVRALFSPVSECVSALARSLFGARSDNDDRFSDCLCDNRTLATLADFTSAYTLLGCVSVRGDKDSRTNRAHVWKRKKGSEIYIYENSISIYFVHRSGEEGVGRGERETVLSHIHIHMRTLPTILHKPRRGHNRDCKKRLYSSHTHHIARHGMAWHVGMNVTRIPWGHFSDYLYK